NLILGLACEVGARGGCKWLISLGRNFKFAVTVNLPIPAEFIEQKIFFIRGHKVLIDRDLAALYEVPVKALNQAVKRNLARFPEDFMFQLTLDEATALLASRSQNVTLKRGRNVKYSPYAFTEQGVAMLATV